MVTIGLRASGTVPYASTGTIGVCPSAVNTAWPSLPRSSFMKSYPVSGDFALTGTVTAYTIGMPTSVTVTVPEGRFT